MGKPLLKETSSNRTPLGSLWLKGPQVKQEYPIPYTLYPIPYTLYSIPYTLYPTPYPIHCSAPFESLVLTFVLRILQKKDTSINMTAYRGPNGVLTTKVSLRRTVNGVPNGVLIIEVSCILIITLFYICKFTAVTWLTLHRPKEWLPATLQICALILSS